MQVQTKLENPTRYHVIEKQKSQVRRYLSESFQQPHEVSTSLLSAHTHSQGHHSHPGIINTMGVPYNPALQSHNQNVMYGQSLSHSQGQTVNRNQGHCQGQNMNHGQGHKLITQQGQNLNPSPGQLSQNVHCNSQALQNGHNRNQGSTPVSLMGSNQNTVPSVSPDAVAMSPSISSVATSASEVCTFLISSIYLRNVCIK